MAVEVVSRAEKKLVKCKKCEVTLAYTTNDVQAIHGRDISGGPDGCEYIGCPECGNRVVIRSW